VYCLTLKSKNMANTTVKPEMQARAQKNLDAKVKLIQTAPADSKLAKANQHIVKDGLGVTLYPTVGSITLGGAAWFDLSCTMAISNSTATNAHLSASGWGWILGGFECEIVGSFVVDPATIGGSCQFVCVGDDEAIGGLSLTILSNSNTLWGTFAGPAEGAGLSALSHSGYLTIS
jgi:hypothetical protein